MQAAGHLGQRKSPTCFYRIRLNDTHRPVDIFTASFLNVTNDFFRCRIYRGKSSTFFRLDELIVDEEPSFDIMQINCRRTAAFLGFVAAVPIIGFVWFKKPTLQHENQQQQDRTRVL